MTDILKTLREDASLKTLLDYIQKTGMLETLKGDGPYTLFAPNNDAFVRMNISDFLQDAKNLSDTLTYHLVEGKHTAEAIGGMETLGTENGKSLTVALDEGEIVVDNAKFVKTDIECSNGIIHIIDNVFQPHLSGWYREE
jgi:uncharacterized surface protein with fasciclin (FAS1) repeats